MPIQAIIFDMDGLLIDSEKVYWAAGRAVAGRFGKMVKDQTLGRMMGRSPIDSMRVFAEELSLTEGPADLLRMREALVLDAFRAGVEPMPYLMEVLEAMKPRFRLAVATSAPRAYVDVIMGGLGIAGFFEAIQTSDDITHGKPHPEIYQKAMARLGLPPAACVVMEDSSNGALAGQRAGAYVIAVPSQHTRDQDFSFVDFIARDLKEAAEHVTGMQATRQ